MHPHVFLKVCLVLIFLNTIIEKTYPEPSSFYQFYAQKVLFRVPKIYNINFWIENDFPPFGSFPKIIRFGSVTRALAVSICTI